MTFTILNKEKVMQIYTRTGDKGKTKIMGGSAVYKDDARVEAYGTIDELNSHIGLVRTKLSDWEELDEDLGKIQHLLFDCGNDMATPAGDERYSYRVAEEHITWIEGRIDYYSPLAPAVESFILQGGSEVSALLHIARTVCRRAERRVVTFMKDNESNPHALKFVNRFSDYLFAVARVANARAGVQDVLYERGGAVFHLDVKKEDIYEEAPDLEVEE